MNKEITVQEEKLDEDDHFNIEINNCNDLKTDEDAQYLVTPEPSTLSYSELRALRTEAIKYIYYTQCIGINPDTWTSTGVINYCSALIGINTYEYVRHIQRVFGMCHNKNNPSNSDAAKRGRPHIIKIPPEEANNVAN